MITLEGEKEFNDAVQKLIKSVSPDQIEPVLMGAAKMQTREAKKNAPVRKFRGNPKKKPPGQLKKGVKTKKLKRLFGHPATAISAIDWKTSPHMYLVHEGTGERVGGSRSKKYKGKRFGRMPAQPFFAEAWQRKRGEALNYIEKKVKAMIEGAVNK